MSDYTTLFVNDPIIRSFTKEFEHQAYGQGHYSQVFEDFLDFCIFYLSLGRIYEPMERLKKTYKDLDGFMRLFEILGEGSDDFKDMLGTVYMEISSTHKASAMGQFFTPGNVSHMMSEMVLVDMDTEKAGQKIADPSCGSGVMILKAARRFGEKRHLQYFYGADLDRMCCKMCAINMSLNTIPGDVFHMNTLSLQHFGAYSLVLDRLGGRWIAYIVKWPHERIEAINERINQDFQQSSEQKKEQVEAERERQRQEQINQRLRAKDAKKGFAGTLFD